MEVNIGVRYNHLLGVIITSMIIGLAYSTKSKKAVLAIGIFVAAFLLSCFIRWYYNSRIEKVEDERTELISTMSTRNGYVVLTIILFAEYLWEYSNGNTETATKLLIPLALGVIALVISQYHYERVM